jgi:ceramide glucosyltransferase
MHGLLNILFCLAILGSVTSTIYTGMVTVAALGFGARRRRAQAADTTFLPPLSVLKPLHGREPNLDKNLVTFFEQDYPAEFEILFMARHDGDAGLQLAREIGARYPQVDARYLTSGEPLFPNPKMYSLALLSEQAKHEHLITSDADARVAKDYLRRCVQPLEDPALALSSCMYLGITDDTSLATQLEAVGKSVEMGAGVLVSSMLEGTKFALGVTMALRRQSFYDAGGYEDIGQYHAEDYILGKRLADQGKGVIMSPHVIRLVVPLTTLAESLRNQLRWMQSTRRSRPAGHLGTGLTFAMPFGVLGLIWGIAAGRPLLGLLWLLAMCINRWIKAGIMLTALGEESWVYQTWIYPLRDLLGSLIWVGSYLPLHMYYHGATYVLTPEGRLQKPSH